MPLDRRTLLRAAGTGVVFAMLPPNLRGALAMAAPTGGLERIEHVVVFMQENRSFDHYYGTMRGVRGFNDPAAITLPTGRSVFHQPNGAGYVLPYPVGDQFMADVPHNWSDGHNAWNVGRHDQWVPQKSVRTMTTMRRSALPFYYALADAFTVCDDYRCSVMGPTNPNRMYLFTGTIGYEPGTNDRAISNVAWDNATHTGYTWTTYPERLEQAGVTWRVYQEWDNYGDNSLEYFAEFIAVARKALASTGHDKLYQFYYALAGASGSRQQTMLAKLAQGVETLNPEERSLYDRGLRRERPGKMVEAFAADVNAGTLPAVSYLVVPEPLTEHPAWGPNTGADLTKKLLDVLAANIAVWNSTVVLIMYDEEGGFFDHVPPPAPPVSGDGSDGRSTVSTADEITLGAPIGLGMRVPMLVVSPWSRGGNVCSQVYDHTW